MWKFLQAREDTIIKQSWEIKDQIRQAETIESLETAKNKEVAKC
jgi:hypothetical protein